MATLELCLPHMVVCVDESRSYDFAATIEYLSPGGWIDGDSNLGDPFAFKFVTEARCQGLWCG